MVVELKQDFFLAQVDSASYWESVLGSTLTARGRYKQDSRITCIDEVENSSAKGAMK